MNTDRVLYLDCRAGVCGSMLLGALLDAGVDREQLEAGLRGLRIAPPRAIAALSQARAAFPRSLQRPAAAPRGAKPGDSTKFTPAAPFTLQVDRVTEHGITATRLRVRMEPDQPHRGLSSIENILEKSDLPANVREQARRVFRRLGAAEAQIHGVDIEEIHFHEVGAIDAIVDIVGVCLGLHLLGITRIVTSPINTGSGFVDCAHGRMPVPAPATAALLRGLPTYAGTVPDANQGGVQNAVEIPIARELTTPTGAAIVATLAESAGPQPLMSVQTIGYGAGEHKLPVPNLLRILIGAPVAASTGAPTPSSLPKASASATPIEQPPWPQDTVIELQFTLDDASPEWTGYLFEQIYAAGALEAYLSPVQMKKNRPAGLLTVLCAPEREAAVTALIFRESTTLGMRRRESQRWVLERRTVSVETEYGPVDLKIGEHADTVYNVAPEYESCRATARQAGVPLKTVYAAALRAWHATESSTQ